MAISSRAERLCKCGGPVKYRKTRYGTDLCRKCYSVADYREHRDARLEKQNNYYQTDSNARDRTRNRSLLKNRELYQKYREAIFDLKGRECVRCGYSDKRALEFDHINGGGCKQQREMRGWRKRLQWMLDNPAEIQILCACCNRIKRAENNEQPPGPPRRF